MSDKIKVPCPVKRNKEVIYLFVSQRKDMAEARGEYFRKSSVLVIDFTTHPGNKE